MSESTIVQSKPAMISFESHASATGNDLASSKHRSAAVRTLLNSHPLVKQYFAEHPRRPQVSFGPYLLLQTLGEGEFGKVKLGYAVSWFVFKQSLMYTSGSPLSMECLPLSSSFARAV